MNPIKYILLVGWLCAGGACAQISGTVLQPGSTPILSGTNGYCEYNNNGKLGEQSCSQSISGAAITPSSVTGAAILGSNVNPTTNYVNAAGTTQGTAVAMT